MCSQAWYKENRAMGGNTSLYQWGSFCQEQLSHQEDPRTIAKLESAWREVTGHKISSDLVLVHWADQKAHVKNSQKGLCACASAIGGEGEDVIGFPPESTFSGSALLFKTSGKTWVSTHGGWEGWYCALFISVCLNSFVCFCFAGQE